MRFDSSKVKPAKARVSDKYSWNLYRFFRFLEKEGVKHPSMDYKILYYKKSPVDGSIVEFKPTESLHAGHIFITKVYPSDQGTASRRISEIFGMSPNKRIEFYCYDFSLESKHIVDITEWFWDEYVKHGRCIFDREHIGWWQGDDVRFTTIGQDTRRCNWCGEVQEKTVEEVVVKQEKWKAAV
jgi:hypothetical protein